MSQTIDSSHPHTKEDPLIERRLDDVWTLINRREAANAQKACSAFNMQYPDSAGGWFATSFLAFQLNQYEQSLNAIEKALACDPQGNRWLLHKAHTLMRMNRRQNASEIAVALVGAAFDDVDSSAELAWVLNGLELFEQAHSQYEKALELIPGGHPARAQLLFNLASVQRYLGKTAQAEQTLEQALVLNPSDAEGQLLRSGLRKQTKSSNHIEQLKQLASREKVPPLASAQIHYALAKEYEDLNQYQDSFAALSKGAAARRNMMQYDVIRDETIMVELRQHFTRDLINQARENGNVGHTTKEPVFILGLPRTGSTLVDRILGQSEDVYSAGELNHFAIQMMAMIEQKKEKISTPAELVKRSTQLDFDQLGRAYLDSTRPDTGHTKHFIDKLPLNSLNVGLIHLALPDAKMIYVQRNPMDACYAMYKTLFTNGYPFSYQLDELARYYAAHHALMTHWLMLLTDNLYVIDYDKLVSDPLTEGKKLFGHCGLTWHDDYVRVEQNAAPSTTASATQVRQAIHTGSVQKWRNYEKQLAPLKTELVRRGIVC